MLTTSSFINSPSQELCDFLIRNLGISRSELELGIKRSTLENAPLPIVMWSYCLINLSDLKIILLWLKDN